MLCLTSCKSDETVVHIFSNIEECESILELKSEDANVKVYDSPVKDKYLKKLEFEYFFGCRYSSQSFSFEIFVYEFPDSATAMKYFKNINGKGKDPNPTFSDSTGMTKFDRTVIKDNKAFRLNSSKKDKKKVIEFINSCFTDRVYYYKWQ